MNTENKNGSLKGMAGILALVRFVLLAAPEVVAVKFMHQNVAACIMMCVGILAVWLSVDFGPFRAAGSKPQPFKAVAAKSKLTGAQALSQAAIRVLMFVMIFQSRLTHI
jgi:hypothetical protein